MDLLFFDSVLLISHDGWGGANKTKSKRERERERERGYK